MYDPMTPTAKAHEILAALKAKISHRKFTPRVWTGEDGRARIYTGSRGEYIEVGVDGTVTTSQTCMSWGHIIREVI